VSHLYLKGNVWWYQRKVPVDLQARLGGLKFKRLSLRTKSKDEAVRKGAKQADIDIDNATWALMRDPLSNRLQAPTRDLTKVALATLQRLEIKPGAMIRGKIGSEPPDRGQTLQGGPADAADR
jgi:hypothetical protein